MLPSRALENAEQTQLLFPQWVVVRYLASMVPWPYPADAAFVYYRDITLPAVERGDAWRWTLRLKSDPARIIGAIGLMRGEKENRGFCLAPLWHGQGLMSEASDAVTDYWFERLEFPALRIPKAAENLASRRISERCGMRVVGTEERDYVSGRLFTEVWEITAQEWRDWRASSAPQ